LIGQASQALANTRIAGSTRIAIHGSS
jgi:hypothetical protein